MEDNPSFSIKGVGERLIITVEEQSAWEQAQEELLARIEGQGEFFKGAQVAIQVGGRTLGTEDIRGLKDKLASHDVKLQALLSASPETLRSARRSELDTDLPADMPTQVNRPARELPPIDANENGEPATVFKSTLRSGRVIKHVGHVIILGDVNPGAQVIAGGDVIVWGRLRGTVHAGANGNEEARVCALDMRPTQLRIANHVAISPDEGKPRPHPEQASVKNGQIVAKEWGV